jgi:hypothetical protein
MIDKRSDLSCYVFIDKSIVFSEHVDGEYSLLQLKIELI